MGKINVYDKVVIEIKKKGENIENQINLYKSPSKAWFRNGICSLLRRADTRRSPDIIYRICDAYCGSGIVIDVIK